MKKIALKYRALSDRLPGLDARRIVIITGARQTGKTTLSKKIYPNLRYINLDAVENREALRTMPTAAWALSVGNAIVDEAQKAPEIFDKVKFAYDEGGVTFTVLTGSSQIRLLKKIRESLAGRAFFYELWPLMQCELNAPWTVANSPVPLLNDLLLCESTSQILSDVPPVLLDSDALIYQQAEDYILDWGGMPALLPLGVEERWEWLKNFGYTYLERDLADLARLDDLSPFRRFQKLSALRSGMLLNYSDLARDTGISVDTARRYLEYLRLSYQTILLQPYRRNVTSSVIKTPKIYWTDIGVFRQLTGYKGELSGQVYESMVVAEIVKWVRTRGLDLGIYFYRTRSGMEVDLVIETSSGLLGIEIKSRALLAPKDIRPMKILAEHLRKNWIGGLVVYTGDEIKRVGPHGIWAVPSKRLLQPPVPIR